MAARRRGWDPSPHPARAATLVAPPGRVPTVVHVVRYPFGPNSHPAIWRTILGLSRHFQNVVVSGSHPGYFPQCAVDGVRLANEAGIHVLEEQDVEGLPRPGVAAGSRTGATRRPRRG